MSFVGSLVTVETNQTDLSRLWLNSQQRTYVHLCFVISGLYFWEVICSMSLKYILDINVFLIGRFMLCYVIGNIPDVFSHYFEMNSDLHNHYAREGHQIHVRSERWTGRAMYQILRKYNLEFYSESVNYPWHLWGSICKSFLEMHETKSVVSCSYLNVLVWQWLSFTTNNF